MTMTATLCLAAALYHEARGEPEPGQFAVAETIMRRVEDGRWPDDVCSVVHQPHQFSWTADPQPVRDMAAWDKSLAIAEIVMSGQTTATYCADHYARIELEPDWAQWMIVDIEIGDHSFYCSNVEDWSRASTPRRNQP